MENIEKCGNKRNKRLFCKHEHEYKYKEQMLINTVMQKMIVYKCENVERKSAKLYD